MGFILKGRARVRLRTRLSVICTKIKCLSILILTWSYFSWTEFIIECLQHSQCNLPDYHKGARFHLQPLGRWQYAKQNKIQQATRKTLCSKMYMCNVHNVLRLGGSFSIDQKIDSCCAPDCESRTTMLQNITWKSTKIFGDSWFSLRLLKLQVVNQVCRVKTCEVIVNFFMCVLGTSIFFLPCATKYETESVLLCEILTVPLKGL